MKTKKKILLKALTLISASVFIVSLLPFTVHAETASDPINNTINTLAEFYRTIRGGVTIAAGLVFTVAILMCLLSKNQKYVDEGKHWAIRVLVCWAIIMSVGSIFTYVNSNFLNNDSQISTDIGKLSDSSGENDSNEKKDSKNNKKDSKNDKKTTEKTTEKNTTKDTKK